MRIKSSFKDYYDIAAGYGQYGAEPFYLREKETIQYEQYYYPFPQSNFYLGNNERAINVSMFTIGFCGQIYHVFKVIQLGSIQYFYSKEKLFDFIETTKYNEQFNTKRHSIARWAKKRGSSPKESLISYLNKIQVEKQQEYLQYFKNRPLPIFVGHPEDRTVVWNDWLGPYEFAKVMNPPQAYQTIEAFLSNIATPLKPIPSIDDKTMVEVKGFNKYSFMKDKKVKE